MIRHIVLIRFRPGLPPSEIAAIEAISRPARAPGRLPRLSRRPGRQFRGPGPRLPAWLRPGLRRPGGPHALSRRSRAQAAGRPPGRGGRRRYRRPAGGRFRLRPRCASAHIALSRTGRAEDVHPLSQRPPRAQRCCRAVFSVRCASVGELCRLRGLASTQACIRCALFRWKPMRRQASCSLSALALPPAASRRSRGCFARLPPDTGLAFVIVAHLAPEQSQHARRDRRAVHGHAGGAGARRHARSRPTTSTSSLPTARSPSSTEGLRVHALAAVRARAAPDRPVLHQPRRRSGRACHRHRPVRGRQRRHAGHQGDQGTRRADPGAGHRPQRAAPRRHAVAAPSRTGLVDLVVPVEAMGAKAGRLCATASCPPRIWSAASPGEPPEAGEATARREICAILRAQVGHDFSGYKDKTFLRRVQRRMQVRAARRPRRLSSTACAGTRKRSRCCFATC